MAMSLGDTFSGIEEPASEHLVKNPGFSQSNEKVNY